MRHHNNSVFHDLLKRIPWAAFDRLVASYEADRRVRRLRSQDRLIALLYGQLSGAGSLREIVGGLHSHKARLYHVGGRAVQRSTLADANANRPAESFAEMVGCARRGMRRKLGEATYLIDATGVRLGRRVVLPLGQAEPQDQALPRRQRKCRAHPDRRRPDRLSALQPRPGHPENRRIPARLRTPRARQPHTQKAHRPPHPTPFPSPPECTNQTAIQWLQIKTGQLWNCVRGLRFGSDAMRGGDHRREHRDRLDPDSSLSERSSRAGCLRDPRRPSHSLHLPAAARRIGGLLALLTLGAMAFAGGAGPRPIHPGQQYRPVLGQ